MAKYQLLLPKMGESVAEATIIKWVKNQGDKIEADDAVVEIATDKVDSEVPSPVAGILVSLLCKENDVIQVGDAIAIIETEEEGTKATTQAVAEPITPQPETNSAAKGAPVSTDIPGIEQLTNRADFAQSKPQYIDSTRFYSPLVRNIAHQEGITAQELNEIPGTGTGGRLTKDDLLNYISKRHLSKQTPAAPQETSTQTQPAENKFAAEPAPVAQPRESYAPQPTVSPAVSVSGGDEIIEMDRMRKLIAEHMVMSKHTSPHVTSFVEADVTSLVLWRNKIKDSFEKRKGEKITYTPVFIEAVAQALKEMPMVNVSVNGTQIIKKKNINIGMATALPSGNLIVPVIRNADELSLVGLTATVNDLARRARAGGLRPEEVKDGTFTVTNVGSFGNVMGTPIINQPQVAILAVGAIKKKPAVLETPTGDVIAIRHMMFLSLSYDHRVVDGALGGAFVKRVADYLENWDINRDL